MYSLQSTLQNIQTSLNKSAIFVGYFCVRLYLADWRYRPNCSVNDDNPFRLRIQFDLLSKSPCVPAAE